MATGYGQTGRSVSIGRVVSRTFGAIAANPGVMLVIAFLFGALPQTALGYFQETATTQDWVQNLAGPGTTIALIIGVSLANMVVNLTVQGGLVRATMSELEGRRATLGECLATGLRRALPLLGVALMTSLGIAVGVLLLIVPGIILYLMWSVAVPVTVVERRGVIDSMSRSGDLTAGARGKIFALMLLILAVTIAGVMIAGLVAAAIGGTPDVAQDVAREMQSGPPIVTLAIEAVFTTLVTVFTAVMPTALYVELREWKDGPIGESLADIFA